MASSLNNPHFGISRVLVFCIPSGEKPRSAGEEEERTRVYRWQVTGEWVVIIERNQWGSIRDIQPLSGGALLPRKRYIETDRSRVFRPIYSGSESLLCNCSVR